MEPSPSHSATPPLPSKESLIKRYKPIWRLLLIFNLALGGYMFAKSRKKNMTMEDRGDAKTGLEESKAAVKDPFAPTATIPFVEEPLIPIVATKPVKVQKPIPEDQQRELFKWILEEKRKIKPKNPEEKKKD